MSTEQRDPESVGTDSDRSRNRHPARSTSSCTGPAAGSGSSRLLGKKFPLASWTHPELAGEAGTGPEKKLGPLLPTRSSVAMKKEVEAAGEPGLGDGMEPPGEVQVGPLPGPVLWLGGLP